MDTNYFRLMTVDHRGRREEIFKGSEGSCMNETDRLLAECHDEFALEQARPADGSSATAAGTAMACPVAISA